MSEPLVLATLEYEGKQYVVEREAGDAARLWPKLDEAERKHELEGLTYYMWTEGNYSCDCNLFSFISDVYDDFPVEENVDDEDEPSYPCGETVKLVSLTLDGKDLLAPTARERLAAIGLFSYGGL